MCVKIDVLDYATLMSTLSHEISEVLECHLAFATDFESLFPACAQLLYRACQANTEIVCGETENLAHGARDARAVSMDIIDCCKLRRNLLG